jgi:S1-C subfamily serine protease
MSSDQILEAQRLSREFLPGTAGSVDILTSFENAIAAGTGFFITDDGYLVTNAHVVEGATRVRIRASSGTISAKIVRADAATDLALLKADGKFSPLPIVASKSVHLGNSVVTVGFPDISLQGFAPKFARGEIAALSGAADDARYFQISVPLQPGNSGGALVDEHGNVVGVVAAKLNALTALNTSGALPENVNYAIKSSYLLSFLESVPDVSAKLKEPETKDRKSEDVVKDAEQAAVLVLVY